jgi:aminomethyltransferase
MNTDADDDRRSPLHRAHVDAGARLTEFGGWAMPVSFAGIQEEHHAVRNAAGVFDVSHMGEVEVTGPDAEPLMQRLTSNDVTDLDDGDAQYAMITDEEGIIFDDTVVYRRGPESFLFVPNAGHDAEMAGRWTDHRDAWGLDASVENVTEEYAMLAVQGPDAPAVVAGEAGSTVGALGWFEFVEATVAGVECLVSRSGYTGEPGFEVLAPWGDAEAIWDAFVVVGGCEPCGLGARDTLRTEMGYLLSGQDFHPEENPRNPFEADVAFAVDLEAEFVGRDALVRVREAGGPEERLAGFVLEERGVPRHGYPILAGETAGSHDPGEVVGEVTSGTMSPTLGDAIGLGYVPVEYADPGTEFDVLVRDREKRAEVESLPFYERE